jgi:hypothetical protein
MLVRTAKRITLPTFLAFPSFNWILNEVLGGGDCEQEGGYTGRRQWRFATIEAMEGGGGSSVDLLDVLTMCGSDFP